MSASLQELRVGGHAGRRQPGQQRRAGGADHVRQGRASQARWAGRLLDQHGHAAGPGAAQATARDRRAGGRRAERGAGAGSGALRGRRARLRQPVPVRRLVPARAAHGARCGRALWRRRRPGGPKGAGGVRVGQSHGSAGGRQRPPCRLRRRAVARARPPRPRGVARVLLQRRRRADPAARRVRDRARSGRERPRGRLPGRVRARPRRPDPGRRVDGGRRGRGARGRAAAGPDQGHAGALRRALRPVLLRAHAA